MTFDRAAVRRETLQHLLRFAEQMCEQYARQAARDYEKRAPELFAGLAARFDLDWSRMKAKEKEHA